jgi:superfamily II DNA or RNA helicase
MEILDNKAVLIRTRNPAKYTVIPKSRIVEDHGNGGYTVAVFFGLDEMRVLRNLGVKKVVSPITRKYNWPGRYRPMDHQVDTASFLTLHRRAFCFNEPGTGKTLSALWAADYLMKRGEVRRVLILCPLSIMHSAWMGDIMNSVMHRSAVVAHHAQASRRIELVQGDYEFVIANYEGLNLINREVLNDGRFDLIIVDECFVAGTLVSTPQGRRPIEQLEAGDAVLTSDGVMRIKRLVRNTATQLVEVKLGNGKTIRCTPEHPFFTDAGWVCAKNLAGRRLISGVEMSCLRAGISPRAFPGAVGYGEQPTPWSDLLKILRTEEVALSEPQQEHLLQLAARAAGETVGAKDSGAPSKTVGSGESAGAQTGCAGRKWHGNDADGAVDFRGLTCGVGMELPGSVGQEAARLSYELQARLCVAAPQSGAGSGRGQSHPVSAASAGSEEGSQAGGAWVESVSYIECPNGEPVYNLEVEGTPNYFVGDHWLVHNCNAYKNPTTQRWKSLQSIVQPHTYLWMMTGTPASQSPVDAYGLAKLVNPNGVPKFYTAWRDKVMNKITQFKWAPKPESKTLVHEALQPAIRFTKAQCLDLPPVLTVTRDVALSPQQTKYYKLLKEQMLVQAAGETISAVNAGVMVSKLLQVSCGAAYTDDREVVEFDASARLKVLMEVIEETNRKVIIFAMFRSSIDTITTYLEKNNVKTAQIHGDVSATKRGAIINDFQHTPNVQVLVMQPQATAHGITLTAADTVVFYGPLMSVEMYLQCIARADRKGQNSDKVTVVHIQSSPIEQKMFKAMASKVSDHALLVGMFDSEVKNS